MGPLPPKKSGYVIYEWYLLIPAKLATFPRFGVNDAKLQTTLLTFANKFFVGIILHWPPKKSTTAGAASASVVVVPSSFIRTNWAQFKAGLAFKHRGCSECSNTVSYIDIFTQGDLDKILFRIFKSYTKLDTPSINIGGKGRFRVIKIYFKKSFQLKVS